MNIENLDIARYINVKKPHIGLNKSYNIENRVNIRVLETKKLHKLAICISLKCEDLPTWMVEKYPSLLQVISNMPSKSRT